MTRLRLLHSTLSTRNVGCKNCVPSGSSRSRALDPAQRERICNHKVTLGAVLLHLVRCTESSEHSARKPSVRNEKVKVLGNEMEKHVLKHMKFARHLNHPPKEMYVLGLDEEAQLLDDLYPMHHCS